MFTRTDLPGERQVYRTSGSLVAWWAWVAFAVVLGQWPAAERMFFPYAVFLQVTPIVTIAPLVR